MITDKRYPADPILLVDDEAQVLDSIELTCRVEGFTNIRTCSDPTQVPEILEDQPVSICVIDLNMPEMSGQELLAYLRLNHPDIPVIILTGCDELDQVVECMKQGAADYLSKPVESLRLGQSIRQCLELRTLISELSQINKGLWQEDLEKPEHFDHIITCSDLMIQRFKYVEAVSSSSRPVLIMGETGTGKELMAKAVHLCSGRSGEFIAINVSGLDETSFSDSLFGHKKGAFTGAENERAGALATASGGTLLLDEIGDLSEENQIKLLRVIQEGEYFPLGSDRPKKCDVRIVGCTNYPQKILGSGNKIRKDFFYRISAHKVEIPPLRERLEDLEPLMQFFMDQASREMGVDVNPSLDRALVILRNHSFPGNVRELQGLVYDAVAQSTGGKLNLDVIRNHCAIDPDSVDAESRTQEASLADFRGSDWWKDLKRLPTLKQATNELIEEALRRSDGNQSLAASILGISRQALNRRLIHKSGK